MEAVMTMNTKLAERARSRTPSPAPGARKKFVPRVKYCVKHFKFLQKKVNEDCTDKDCKFPHMSLEKVKEEQKAARDKAKIEP